MASRARRWISSADSVRRVMPRAALVWVMMARTLGGHYLTVSGSATLTATSAMASASSYGGSGFLWGAGYETPIKESFDLRMEYLGFRNVAGKDNTTDNFCVAVVKHF